MLKIYGTVGENIRYFRVKYTDDMNYKWIINERKYTVHKNHKRVMNDRRCIAENIRPLKILQNTALK